jgi:hypothetical protein
MTACTEQHLARVGDDRDREGQTGMLKGGTA